MCSGCHLAGGVMCVCHPASPSITQPRPCGVSDLSQPIPPHVSRLGQRMPRGMGGLAAGPCGSWGLSCTSLGLWQAAPSLSCLVCKTEVMFPSPTTCRVFRRMQGDGAQENAWAQDVFQDHSHPTPPATHPFCCWFY